MPMLKPQVFSTPFCSGGDFIQMSLTTSSTFMNQITGIPPIFATPYSSGGEPVPVDQTNGIFYSYSTQSVWLQGGGTFTFEPDFVAATGGYDNGALLLDTTTGLYVQSLHNNNTADFISDPTKINNVDWQFYPPQTRAQLDADTFVSMDVYISGGHGQSNWYIQDAGDVNTGFNLTVDTRPAVMGDLDTLTVEEVSVTTFGDFATVLDPDASSQKFPGTSGTQAGSVTITAGNSTVAAVFATPFDNELVGVGLALLSNSAAYKVSYYDPGITAMEIAIDSVALADVTVSYIVFGY